MSRIGDPARSQRGFTLIEILVVLAVVGLIMAFVLPMISGSRSRAGLRAAANEIAAALRSTRSLATTHGRAETFVLDTAHAAFRAGSTASPQRLPGGIALAIVTIAQERETDTVGSIRFFADGSSTGGGVRLSSGTNESDVLVDWLTGRVMIEDVVHAAAQ